MTEKAVTVFGMKPEKLLKTLVPVILVLVGWGISVEVDRRSHYTGAQVEAKQGQLETRITAEVAAIKGRMTELEKLSTKLETTLQGISSSLSEMKVDLRELRKQLQRRDRRPR